MIRPLHWNLSLEKSRIPKRITVDVIRMMTTNKFCGVVKKWYDSQEALWFLSWAELMPRFEAMVGEEVK